MAEHTPLVECETHEWAIDMSESWRWSCRRCSTDGGPVQNPDEQAAERDRLRGLYDEAAKVCEHVIEWLGDPELENSGNAHPAFVKAMTKCHAIVEKHREASQ